MPDLDKLNDLAIKKAKPKAKPYKLFDGKGLYLLVNVSGSKLWRCKYRVAGKEKLLAIGAYPEISLAAARRRRDEARTQLATDVDPMEARRVVKAAKRLSAENSFRSVAGLWWKTWSTDRTERHAEYVKRRLEADVYPAIGALTVDQIQAPQLVAMLQKIAARGALDIAKRSLQTTSQIFRFAIANGVASRNPANDIKPADILGSRRQVNYARIDGKDLPDLMRSIDAYNGATTTRLAMKLMALTFVRTGELIGARWDEFDLDGNRWDIPATRMKMRSPHIVPLSDQAVEVLRTLKIVSGHSALLFPGERDHKKPMSNNTILKALERMGYKGRMTGHGFRGVASTILHEIGFRHDHIELQLAHQERNDVSAAYNHATYLPERFEMMKFWGDYIANCTSGKVIAGPFRKVA